MNVPAHTIVRNDLFRCTHCAAVSHYVCSEPVSHAEPFPAPSGRPAIDPETGQPVMLEWITYRLKCVQCGAQTLEKVSRAALPFQSHLCEFEQALYHISRGDPC